MSPRRKDRQPCGNRPPDMEERKTVNRDVAFIEAVNLRK